VKWCCHLAIQQEEEISIFSPWNEKNIFLFYIFFESDEHVKKVASLHDSDS
jgi:hypothetical protein